MATLDDDISVKQQIAQNLGLIYQALLNGGVKFTSVPANSAAPGVAGQISADTGFLYICVAASTWRRVAIAAF